MIRITQQHDHGTMVRVIITAKLLINSLNDMILTVGR